MTIPQEVLEAILVIVGFGIGMLISMLASKMSKKTKKTIEAVLDGLETVVVAYVEKHPEIVNESFEKFKGKIEKWIERNLKIDLTDDEWNYIWDVWLKDVYEQIKKELEKEE